MTPESIRIAARNTSRPRTKDLILSFLKYRLARALEIANAISKSRITVSTCLSRLMKEGAPVQRLPGYFYTLAIAVLGSLSTPPETVVAENVPCVVDIAATSSWDLSVRNRE
jgi:biotin operon repressor